MKILFKNYIAEAENDRFNLYKTVKTSKAPVVVGYGFHFEGMLKRIVADLLANGKDTLTIDEYIRRYRGLMEEVSGAIDE